ncbi:2Fe-2S iron-sulfur cluster-binding protein [Actinoplanes sp. NPDC051470]|uniref:2Fe-2S iron-sulfur cluster-binding protein n=2 Tax=unclassified Actinoplanes TaxID=2626549 RepID=UPI00342252B5
MTGTTHVHTGQGMKGNGGHQIRVVVNGEAVEAAVDDPRRSLLDFLREDRGLTGAKFGCGQGGCGACTVLVDGNRILSCLTLAVMVDGSQVTTIEGIGEPDRLHPLQEAFIAHDGFQCGYCTPGQICSAIGMAAELERGLPSKAADEVAADPQWSRPEVRERMSGNVCRCGAYNGIVEAIIEHFTAPDRVRS